MINKEDKILVLGHKGMVGKAITNKLQSSGYNNLHFVSRRVDLRNQVNVSNIVKGFEPNVIIMAAAKVGGILANMNNQSSFLYDNLMINSNILYESTKSTTLKKLIFLGSSCIYPRHCNQPMIEDDLLSGKLEPTNEGYALAKITGLKLAEYYAKENKLNILSVMPCNLYGPGDDFNLNTSHVMAALIRKIVNAKKNNQKSIVLWGNGKAKREFMHVSDFSRAVVFLMNNYNSNDFINVGTGIDISILELANLIKSIVGYTGNFEWDETKPNGMPQKLLDVSKLKSLGFNHKISLYTGIEEMIKLYNTIRGENEWENK